jgi:ligand-binding sensor domain-containing protein
MSSEVDRVDQVPAVGVGCPRRDLHELETDRITAAAAAHDGGLWLGTPQGLFHVDQRVLRQR